MADNARHKLNIHGFIDLDQMATVLSSLIDQVDKQNRVINNLRDSLAFYVDSSLFAEKVSGLELLLNKVTLKIDAVQVATTASVLNKKISSGDLSSSNFQQISKLSKAVMKCATKEELSSEGQRINELEGALLRLQKSVDKIMTLNDQISRSQLNQGLRISALEAAMAGKIDRSEVHHLEALVSKVETYDQFKNSTIDAVGSLQQFESETGKWLKRMAASLDEHAHSLQQHAVDMGKMAPKVELHTLARQLKSQQQQLDECATEQRLQSVRDELLAAEQVIERHTKKIAALEVDAQELHTAVDSKAPLQAVRNCVTRRHYEQAVAALGAEVDSKTPQSTTLQLQQELDALEARLQAESERMSVAMRFVEWYSGRGENYEHNMKIIDKHLKSLISSAPGPGTGEAASKVHSYFMPNNQVIFSPNNPIDPSSS